MPSDFCQNFSSVCIREIRQKPDFLFLPLKRSICTSHIEPQLRKTIEKIIFGYSNIFTLEPDSQPCTWLTEYEIILKDRKPINVRRYRPPECHKNEIKRQIEDMLKKSVIEPCDSPFNSPIWVVPKNLTLQVNVNGEL